MNIELLHGDCIRIMKGIPDNTVDMILTDPPYLHVKGGMKSKKYNVGTWNADSKMITKLSDFDKAKIFEFLDSIIPKMKKVNMYVFCSKLQLVHYFEYILEHKKLKYDLLVWEKGCNTMKSTKFHTTDIEYVIRIYESGVSLYKVLLEDGSKSDSRYYLKCQSYKQPRGEHVTMKPVELLEKYLMVSSHENDIILDPFMGSGSTGVACLNTNRNFIGIELDDTYFKIAEDRINQRRFELE